MAKKQTTKETKVISKEETKEVATAPGAAIVVGSAQDTDAWGASPISSKDIIIPRILLMQPMSEKVTGDQAKFGEFRESLNNELVGNFEKGFEIVPFHMEKVFVEYNIDDPEEKEFLRVVPITPGNESLPYQDEEFSEAAGKKIKISRDYTLNFYVLLPDELALGTALPYILSFRRTSLQAGKKLATQMYVKNINSKQTPASVVCQITSGKQSQDKKTWAVMDVKPLRAASPEHIAKAFDWLKIVKSTAVKVHEESYGEEAKEVSATVSDASPVDTLKGPAQF